MFKYSLDNKRYHTLNYYYKNKYHQKIVKIPVDLGTSCPNKINGGCIFCDGDFACPKSTASIKEQFLKNKTVIDHKWPNSGYVIYFQNGTNTYGDFKKLTAKINEALTIPNVFGITIATRPDCINDNWITYFKELNKKTDLIIELGLQSMHNETLKLINRGHSKKDFDKCVKLLKKHHIKVVAHIINGLPYETKEMMIDTAKYLNDLGIDGIKIHMLYVNKNTLLATWLKEDKFKLLTKEAYIDIVANQLSYLDPKIVIHRITGDPDLKALIAPTFLIKKVSLTNDIDKYMKEHDLYQGCNL